MVVFACLNRQELPKFGLDIHSYNDTINTLFYFSYFDLQNKEKEGKISRPFKYRLDNPMPVDVKSFFDKVRSGSIPKFFV